MSYVSMAEKQHFRQVKRSEQSQDLPESSPWTVLERDGWLRAISVLLLISLPKIE